MDKTFRIAEYFVDVEIVKEHNGYFYSVGEALTVDLPDSYVPQEGDTYVLIIINGTTTQTSTGTVVSYSRSLSGFALFDKKNAKKHSI
jgi:hypothetical protein